MFGRRSIVSGSIALLLSLFLTVVGFATPANASTQPGDWANVPGYSGGETILGQAGGIVGVQEYHPPLTIEGATATVVTYESGVAQSDGDQLSTEVIFVPKSGPTDKTFMLLPATDSLSKWDRATLGVFNPLFTTVDTAAVNYWVSQGYTVVIPDVYGKQNPTYAGKGNGVRARNGMLAVNEFLGHEQTFVVYGQSGGAIDTSFAAESTYVVIPGDENTIYIAEDSPRDLTGMLTNSSGRIPIGLILSAAEGNVRSMPMEDKMVLDRNVRPTIQIGARLLNSTQALPIPLVSMLSYGLLGVLAPDAELLFRPGAYDSAEVQDVLGRVNALQGTPQGKVYLLPKTHDRFVYKSGSYWQADAYRMSGAQQVQVIETDDGGSYPGHYTSDFEYLTSIINGEFDGQGDIVRVTGTEPSLSDKLLYAVAEKAIPVVGDVVNTIAPPLLNVTDGLIDGVGYIAEQVTQATAPLLELVPDLSAQQVPAPVVFDQPQAISNTEVVSNMVGDIASPQVQEVVNSVLDVPVVEDVVNGLPFALPTAA